MRGERSRARACEANKRSGEEEKGGESSAKGKDLLIVVIDEVKLPADGTGLPGKEISF
jgi:hypothetical protein